MGPIKHTVKELNKREFVLRAMLHQSGYGITDIKLRYLFRNAVSNVKYIEEKYTFSAFKIDQDLYSKILLSKEANKNAKTQTTGAVEAVKSKRRVTLDWGEWIFDKERTVRAGTTHSEPTN